MREHMLVVGETARAICLRALRQKVMTAMLSLLIGHSAAFVTLNAVVAPPGASVHRAAAFMRYRRAAGCDGLCDAPQINQLLETRSSLRKERDFAAADSILADLSALGVIIDDDQRTWCLRSWQRPSGNRREQAARHSQEREDKQARKLSKPSKPRVDRSAPYARSALCTAVLSQEKLSEIAASVATRLEAKQQKRYSDADALLADLGKARICVSDERREWRADGITFAAEYSQEGAGGAADDEVSSLVRARALSKAARDYAAADALLDQLLDLGVVVDDRRRAWRFACARRTTVDGGRDDPGHDYVRRAQSDERDAATGELRLALDPRLAGEVDDLLRRRLAAKLGYRYEEADALQAALSVLGIETDERQRTWTVAFAYLESSWRVRE